LTVEADTQQKAEELLEWLRQFVTAENGKGNKVEAVSKQTV
jgi:hypothetical protein